MSLVVIGGDPIAYGGFRTGKLTVAAMVVDSPVYPADRILLGLGNHGDSEAAGLTIDNVDETIARLLEAKKRVLDAADHTVESTHEIGGEVIRLVKSSLGRWGVAYYDNGGAQGEDGAAWRYDWYATEAEARDAHADAIEHEICEGCDALVPAADAVYAGDDVHLCEDCAEGAREEARTTPARHCDPTSCDFAGMISDCTIEDDSILCPKCGEYMEPADVEPVLGEIAELAPGGAS